MSRFTPAILAAALTSAAPWAGSRGGDAPSGGASSTGGAGGSGGGLLAVDVCGICLETACCGALAACAAPAADCAGCARGAAPQAGCQDPAIPALAACLATKCQ